MTREYTQLDYEFAEYRVGRDLDNGIPLDSKLVEHYRHIAREMQVRVQRPFYNRLSGEIEYYDARTQEIAGSEYDCTADMIEELIKKAAA